MLKYLAALVGLFFFLTAADCARAAFHGSATSNGCHYGNSGVDGCGVSPGLYFAPAVNATTQPTAAQWYAYAATSGQTWTSTHQQTTNIAGVDYGVGPNQLISSMADIAGFNSATIGGNPAPVVTKCSYQAALGNTATFNGTVSGSTLTVNSGTEPAVGMVFETGPSGVAANTYILAQLTTNTWTINTTGIYGPESITASDTYQLTGWPAGDPSFICSGTTPPASGSVLVTGWNFGPTAYQGTPVGSHNCVNVVIVPINGTTYTPTTISFSGDAFINGSTCSPEVNGVRFGAFSAPNTLRGSIKVWNAYVDGRVNDPGGCCLPPTNQGIFLYTGALEANIDVEFGYIVNIASAPLAIVLGTGNEGVFSCSNGTAYSSPGYTFTDKFNFYANFGSVYGAGHMEIVAMEGVTGVAVCARYDDFNTVLWSSSTAAEGAASFFYWGTSGTLEYGEIKGNTIVTNLTGGKQYPEIFDYYNWATSDGNPNYVVISATGSGCPIASGLGTVPGWSCGNPVQGQSISGGTNNTYSSIIGLQTNSGTGPITGSLWLGGCNSLDGLPPYNAGTTYSIGQGVISASVGYASLINGNVGNTPASSPSDWGPSLCPTNGNYPALQANVAVPSGGGSVLNSFFNNRVVSETAGEADHGTTTLSTPSVATSGGPFTGTTITLSANCPASAVNTIVTDTTQAGVQVGTVASCPTSGTTLTLYANAAISVANSDALKFAGFSYGTIVWGGATPNWIDSGSSGSVANDTPQVWSANPQVTSGGFQSGGGGGCVVPITISGNVELRTGGATTYPQVNTFTSNSGGC